MRGDPFRGREALCEAGPGWGFKVRALWMDILHVPNHDVADVSPSQDFSPPFGADLDAFYRLEIPPSKTGRVFHWGAVSGFAQAGLRFDGKGTVALQALRTNKYVRAGMGRGSFLAAVSDQIGAWDTFEVRRLREPAQSPVR